MNLEHLRLFYAVANNKNFSQTAKEMHISQSSVSLQVKHLEDVLQAKLFERTTKKVELTPAGEILYEKAGKMLFLMNEIQNELQALKGEVTGRLNIGASLTIGEHVLPFLIAKYKKAYPLVDVRLKMCNSEQIIEKLYKHELNLGFIESMLSYPNIKQLPFQEDELILVASMHSKIVEEGDLPKEALVSLPFIIREKGSGTRQVMEDCLRRNGVNPDQLNTTLELEHTESIKGAVEADLGVSIISRSAVKKELQLGTLREVKVEGVRLGRQFYMVYFEGALQLTSEKLIDFIMPQRQKQ
ncbi:selenium metabolism-associated LysR family transcriptional regulator [Bacillus thermotolerans]|uniref:LysR family transcriptional regulator YeiE n=1 Tax=Bacillus thermotolerans TaxID=1221996 RepID=A0A0F5IAY0_BACTR|nr:selenium metabolism-associated LysR family transcriptional regulator [Bacillus thermotolerans]KKB38846.1 LysR family transcriptional regulator YeiE [Bacillus thermotolerans]KKB42485.1 LysR family transcriptional regulator YeiE [Bacillus thermotolerans]KKB44567.1 LysR family transcriptional regulator YeiE [Bacillus thermotolerans]